MTTIDRLLRVSLFATVSGQSIRHEAMSWQALADLLSAPLTKADKRSLPMFVPTVYGDVWSQGRTPSLKHSGNVLGPVSAVVGDVDRSNVTPAEAAQLLQGAGVEALVVTTSSHRPAEGSNCFRVVCPLAADAPLDELPRLVSFLNGAVGGILASESWNLRRAWFYGRVLGVPFEHHRSPGHCLDTLTARITPQGHKRVPASQHADADPDALEFIAWCHSEDRKLTGEVREIVDLFNDFVGHIEHIRYLLDQHGYEQVGEQWRRPGSEGAPGVQVTRCGQRVISYHASGACLLAAGGESVPRDAFDVTRLLEFGGNMSAAWAHARQVLVDAGVLNEVDAPPAPAEPQSPGPSARRGLRALGLDELQQQPKASWLIKGVLPTQGLACLYGPSGVGKSFALLDMGLSIARGVQWQGQRVTHAAVIHVAAEGGHGFAQRLEVYGKRHGVDVARLPFFVCPSGFDLRSGPDVAEVVAMAEEVSARGLRVGLVVIDTLNRVLPGADENAASDMSAAVAGMAQIAEKLGCLVTIVHHSGKDASKGARGHSSLRAAMDTELSVDRVADGSPLRVIKVTKQRDGADDLKFGFTLEPTFLRYDEDEVTEIVAPVAMAAPVDAVKRVRRAGRPSAWGPAVQQALDGMDGPASEAQVIAAAKAAYSAAGGAAGKNSAASVRRELQRLADEGLVELASGVVSVTEVDPLS